jgi:hypothetical protein
MDFIRSRISVLLGRVWDQTPENIIDQDQLVDRFALLLHQNNNGNRSTKHVSVSLPRHGAYRQGSQSIILTSNKPVPKVDWHSAHLYLTPLFRIQASFSSKVIPCRRPTEHISNDV